MSHHGKYIMPNVPAVTCLVTSPIPYPRKKEKGRKKGDDSGCVTGFSGNRGESVGGEMTLQWFNKIKLSLDYQNHLSYPESCLIVSEDGEGIGKMYTTVEISNWAGTPCLLVHSGSYAKISSEVEVGTSLTGFLTKELQVIQELAHEWCNFKGVKFERKTFLMLESSANSLYCRSTFKRDEVIKYDNVTTVPFIDLRVFLSEAGSILFQRLIILENKSGIITLKGINSKGETLPMQYQVLGRGVENVKGEKMEVNGIRRTLWKDETRHAGQSWDSIFNVFGRLVLRCQLENNDHALIPLWFRPVDEYDEFGQHTGMRPPIIWACDQELYSNYLVKKTELKAQYKTYLVDHPALHALLADFMQKLLFTKPKDVLEFAAEYFTPLLKLRQDSPESSDCESTSTCELWENSEEEEMGEDHKIMQSILDLHSKMYPAKEEWSGESEKNGGIDHFPPPPLPPQPEKIEFQGGSDNYKHEEQKQEEEGPETKYNVGVGVNIKSQRKIVDQNHEDQKLREESPVKKYNVGVGVDIKTNKF